MPHRVRDTRICRVNDFRRINRSYAVNELNYPLFLPCSRPEQGCGLFARRFRPDAACAQGVIMAKPAVIVVGADKGGVGKTTVSRTVLDYFSANNVQTRAFDTESPRGTLE